MYTGNIDLTTILGHRRKYICKTQLTVTNSLLKGMVTAALSKNFTRHWTKKCINLRTLALELVLRENVASGTG